MRADSGMVVVPAAGVVAELRTGTGSVAGVLPRVTIASSNRILGCGEYLALFIVSASVIMLLFISSREIDFACMASRSTFSVDMFSIFSGDFIYFPMRSER